MEVAGVDLSPVDGEAGRASLLLGGDVQYEADAKSEQQSRTG